MERPAGYEKKSDRTRKKLILAAQELLRTGTYDKIGIREITRQAGVAISTFYYYFETKIDVLAAGMEENDERFGTALQTLLESSGEARAAMVQFFCRTLAGILSRDGKKLTRYRLFLVPKKQLRQQSRLYIGLCGLIEKAQLQGELSPAEPPERIAGYLLLVARGACSEWCIAPAGPGLAARFKEVIPLALQPFLQMG